MSRQIAHNIENKARTEDVHIIENVDFTAMLLSDSVLQGLLANGFKKPSPIQLKAIPMGRCGYDLIIQAKSGTGKTGVFGIIALEMIDVTKNHLQVLMLAPTREIAVQIKGVLLSIGMNLKGLKVEYFIGGTSITADLDKLKNCHIAVGAPGRVKHLIKDGHMDLDSVRLFVLDEADKLISDGGQQKDINYIFNKLSSTKQIIASSATYPGDLKKFLTKYMQTPTVIDPHQDVPVLLGIRQFVTTVKSHLNVMQQMTLKTAELIRILQNVSFTQCVVFCNYQTRAETVSNYLSRQGWPTTYISAAQNQKSRLEAVTSLKEFKCRILSTTDLTARGIDAANVDLVINYEIPHDSETYLHRMGRAGRYGSSGLCISIAAEGTEVEKLQNLLGKIKSKLGILKFPKENVPQDIWTCDIEQFEKLYGTIENKNDSEQICNTLKELSVRQDSVTENQDYVEKCIESIIEVAKNEIKPEIEENVELLLDNLKKDDKLSKETCKNQFNNINPAAILDMLAKGDSIDIKKESKVPKEINVEGMLCDLNKSDTSAKEIAVLEILSDINTEEVTSKTIMKNKFGTLDPSSILNLLSQDKFDETMYENKLQEQINVPEMLSNLNKEEETIKNKFDILDSSSTLNLLTENDVNETTPPENSDNKIKKSRNKKIKRNENKVGKSSCRDTVEKENNKQFENEAKLFQKNSVVHKNIALYNITKVVVEQESVTEENVTSTEKLLQIMQQEDNFEIKQQKSKLAFTDLLSQLGLKSDENKPNIKTWQVVNNEFQSTDEESVECINKWEVVNTSQISEENVECACSENLFSDVFDYACSRIDTHWQNSICQIHQNIETEEPEKVNEEQENLIENYCDENEEYHDANEEFYDENKEYYGENEEVSDENNDNENEEYNDENLEYSSEQNGESEAMDTEVVYDEDIFIKAYDYALRSTVTNYDENETMNCDENEAFGYAAAFSYDHLKTKNRNSTRKNKRKHTNENSELMPTENKPDVNHTYETYFDYYDKMLAENAPYFTDVSEFETWFGQWQENVYGVRNHIQEEIIAREKIAQRNLNC